MTTVPTTKDCYGQSRVPASETATLMAVLMGKYFLTGLEHLPPHLFRWPGLAMLQLLSLS